jgi:hypothetical protein
MKIKTGNHQYQRYKRQDQYDVRVPFSEVTIDITGTALGKKKWQYACRLLGMSSLKEGVM